MAGMDKHIFSVYPLTGKFLNVIEASNEIINNNVDIQNIKKFLDSGFTKSYSNMA